MALTHSNLSKDSSSNDYYLSKNAIINLTVSITYFVITGNWYHNDNFDRATAL